MPERERARWGDKIVTVIGHTGSGKSAKVDIRDSNGFTHTVKATELRPLDEGDPLRTFKFVGSE